MMTRRTRLRRTGILCLHCLRNAAYYRARTAAPAAKFREQFWRTIDNNFVDISLLEWCKLFGDTKAKHHWSKVVSDQNAFLRGLYARTMLDEQAFESYRIEVRTYRDKLVAHLDEFTEMAFKVPHVQPAIDSARYLYDYLLANENSGGVFHGVPPSASSTFKGYLEEGRAAYKSQRTI